MGSIVCACVHTVHVCVWCSSVLYRISDEDVYEIQPGEMYTLVYDVSAPQMGGNDSRQAEKPFLRIGTVMFMIDFFICYRYPYIRFQHKNRNCIYVIV
jgi:hypothetical protein